MKQSEKRGRKNKIGAWGEEIAVNYLKEAGFSILDTNYLKKWGEIDIVARENNKIRFVEVKTVSYETREFLERAILNKNWRPEENVHKNKLNRWHRVIESWLSENKYEGDWQIDIMAIRLVPREKYATVKLLQNIII